MRGELLLSIPAVLALALWTLRISRNYFTDEQVLEALSEKEWRSVIDVRTELAEIMKIHWDRISINRLEHQLERLEAHDLVERKTETYRHPYSLSYRRKSE